MATPVFNSEKSLQAVLYIANRVERKDFHKILKCSTLQIGST